MADEAIIRISLDTVGLKRDTEQVREQAAREQSAKEREQESTVDPAKEREGEAKLGQRLRREADTAAKKESPDLDRPMTRGELEKILEEKRKRDAEAKRVAERSHAAMGSSVSSAVRGDLSPLSQIAKDRAKKTLESTAAGQAATAAAGKFLGTAAMAAGVVAAGVYGMQSAAILGSEAGTALTGIGGSRGDLTGPLQGLISSFKKAINVPSETYRGLKAGLMFKQTAKEIAHGTNRRLAVQQARDREEAEFDEEEMRAMLKGWFSTLGPELAEIVWDATKAGAGDLFATATATVRKMIFGV